MSKRFLAGLLFAFLLSTSGCLISEQMGQDREDLTFHFDTEFNRIALFARSGALAAVALWLFAGAKKSPGSAVLGGVLLAAAAWLVVKDYPTLRRYHVQVLGEGLVLGIPPEEEMTLPWGAIEEMYVEGVGSATEVPRDEFERRLSLPDWHSMRITVTGGATHDVDLKLLSVEQRQILWRAIARRASLVEIRQP
jgi:hypothetical protein